MKYREVKNGDNRYPTLYKEMSFSDIADMNNFLATTEINAHFKKKGELSSVLGEYGFTKTRSLEEAETMLRVGWPKMAEKLAKAVKPSVATSTVKRPKPTYGLVGGQASVPRYIQGIPTNMVDRKMEAQKQKIIVINKDIAYNAGVRAFEIEEEGIKALQIIRALEGKGFRVKLNLCWASESGQECLAFKVCVKKPEERLSLAKIAFPIAHPSMLRRIGFAWMERNPYQTESGFCWGYGRPANSRLALNMEKKEILLPAFIPDVDNFVKNLKV